MFGKNEDDRDAVDRAFADLVAGYHLTSDRPDPLAANDPGQGTGRPDPQARSASTTTRTPAADPGDPLPGMGAGHPDADLEQSSLEQSGRGESGLGESGLAESGLGESGLSGTGGARELGAARELGESTPVERGSEDAPLFRFEQPEEVEAPAASERFVPEPLLPLPRPAWPVLVAWIAMGYALLAVLAAAMGAHLPRWAGWIALVGFLGGFGLLVTRLPRNRPPDAGDGAVL